MKKYCIILPLAILSLAILTTILTTGSTPAFQEEASSHHSTIATTTSPVVPRKVSFAGKEFDLTRYDLRERFDRELSSFTYMHSTSMLLIKRANRFFPIVEPLLKANGVPDDFKYLMVIESNLNTLAKSPVGAAGLWQFMEATGREFGLEVNKNIDERYNIEKATVAACKYLKEGYDKYGDWITVAASYNAGFRRISNALEQQEADSAIDLWLNDETSRYMFRIMAAKTVFEQPADYGFHLLRENLYPVIPYKTVSVRTPIANLTLFAQKQGITYAQLKDANPWLRGTSLENRSAREYIIKIPTKEGMNYDPKKTEVHDKRWIAK